MSWEVVWLPDAEQELADAWLNASDREAVSRASHLIDQQLQSNPENSGQPYTNGRRSLLVMPLGAIYRVLPDVQRVEVVHVWVVRHTNGQTI